MSGYKIDISRHGFQQLLLGQTIHLSVKEGPLTVLDLQVALKPECFKDIDITALPVIPPQR